MTIDTKIDVIDEEDSEEYPDDKIQIKKDENDDEIIKKYKTSDINENDKKHENNTQYKFILIGDSSVGKTSIFKKITTEIFSVKNISTIGMDKRTLNFKDIEVNINGENKKMDFDLILFDTAGQERYRSITKTYFQSSDGVIILYDITNKKTFEGVETWLDSLDQVLSTWKTNHYVVTLLGNKLDLVTNGEKSREVEEEEASKLEEMIWKSYDEINIDDITIEPKLAPFIPGLLNLKKGNINWE